MRRVLPILAVCACDPGEAPLGPTPPLTSGGQSGSDPGPTASCGETALVVDPEEPFEGPDGPFAATDLMAFAEGSLEAEWTWEGGATTGLWLELAWDGEVRHVLPAAGGPGCAGRVEVTGAYALSTGDGALDEAGLATLRAERSEEASFGAVWFEGELGGSFAFPDDGQTSTLQLHAALRSAGPTGELSLWTPEEPAPGSTAGSPVGSFAPAGG